MKMKASASGGATELVDPLEACRGEFVVLKLGGHSAEARDLARFAEGVGALQGAGALPVVVHGGGPQIDAMMRRLGLEPRFADGLRVTDEAALRVAEMVLLSFGKAVGAALQRQGVSAIALSGQDAGILRATTKDPALGFVGGVASVNTVPLALLAENGIVPVIAPIGSDGTHALNVNADEASGAIAAALGARALLLLSNVDGVLARGGRAAILAPAEAQQLIATGAADAGMIPKLRAAVAAAEAGVPLVRISKQEAIHRLLTLDGPGTRVIA